MQSLETTLPDYSSSELSEAHYAMKVIRVLTLSTAFALSFSLGLQAQTSATTDSKESVMQPENKPAPAMDSQTTAPDKNRMTAPDKTDQKATPDQKTPSSMDTLGYDGNVCGAACS